MHSLMCTQPKSGLESCRSGSARPVSVKVLSTTSQHIRKNKFSVNQVFSLCRAQPAARVSSLSIHNRCRHLTRRATLERSHDAHVPHDDHSQHTPRLEGSEYAEHANVADALALPMPICGLTSTRVHIHIRCRSTDMIEAVCEVEIREGGRVVH